MQKKHWCPDFTAWHGSKYTLPTLQLPHVASLEPPLKYPGDVFIWTNFDLCIDQTSELTFKTEPLHTPIYYSKWIHSNSIWHCHAPLGENIPHLFRQSQWRLLPLFNCLLSTAPSLCWPWSTCDCDTIILKKYIHIINCLVWPLPLSYCASEKIKRFF